MKNNKFNEEVELNQYQHIYNRMCYDLLSEPLFQSFGLELSAATIIFETNNSFALVGSTFAYFNPIDSTIHVNIEDPFFRACKDDLDKKSRLLFILFHEMYHKVLLHDNRSAKRDKMLWNIAADCEVHNMMYLYKEVCKANIASAFGKEFDIIENMFEKCNNPKYEGNPAEGEYAFMFDKHYLNNIAEEIYADIMNSKKIEQQSFSLDLNKMMGNSHNQSNNQNNNSDSDNQSNENDSGNNQANIKKSSNKTNSTKSGNQKNFGNASQDANAKNSTGMSSRNSVTVTTTTYQLPNGRKVQSVNIDWPENSQLPSEYKKDKDQLKRDKENAELRHQVMEQNLKNEMERNKGNISADCNTFLKKLFKVKIDWEKILKNSLQTVLTKSDYFSWARPRKMTMTLDLPYLPDLIDDNGAYGKLFICVDQSGSMSNEEFQKIGNIILSAKEHYKKIIVIQHDSEINNVFEFEEINDDTLKNVFTRTSNGGTSHYPVYKYIAEDWAASRYDDENKISAVIVCSDCCSDIQDAQKQLNAEIPMIYLTPEHCKEYCAGIRGQIIEVS